MIICMGETINIVSDRHFTVREDTEVADNFVCNNNSDCEDVNEPVGFMLKFRNKKLTHFLG